ncbi:hypothetical protein NQ318_023637 [Aromia moschata]|uniref:Transposase n=1 Tax=Aromia moschata TaxID=1265417 RepID=A0AAV8YS80_9CUCU|nr:hypothetical protein NQ318_023637 [Aromia moschata]
MMPPKDPARLAEDPRILANIIFSDESTFTRSGVFNMHNEHVWAEENPYARKVTHYQQSFKINVWAATLGNCLLGYHIIPGNLNGELYQEFLSTRFHEFLEDIPWQDEKYNNARGPTAFHNYPGIALSPGKERPTQWTGREMDTDIPGDKRIGDDPARIWTF